MIMTRPARLSTTSRTKGECTARRASRLSCAVSTPTGKAPMLCADRFTAADIAIGYALRLAENIGLAKDFGPNVAAYWQRLQARDGYKRAVAAEVLAGEEQKVAARVRS